MASQVALAVVGEAEDEEGAAAGDAVATLLFAAATAADDDAAAAAADDEAAAGDGAAPDRDGVLRATMGISSSSSSIVIGCATGRTAAGDREVAAAAADFSSSLTLVFRCFL